MLGGIGKHGGRTHMDDEAAEWYVKNYGDHPTNRWTVELARLQPNDVALDIGCGSGTAVRKAAARLIRGRAIGVDPSPAMLRIATEQTAGHEGRERIEFLQGHAGHLPLPGDSITVVWAINSIHHWDDVGEGLREVRRVLRTDGRFLVTEEDVDGRFGHGDAPLSDPNMAAHAIGEAGFVDVVISKHSAGEAKMFTVVARFLSE